MVTTKYLMATFMFFILIGNAQDRKKELDSLILHAQSLPDDTLKAKVLSRIHERMMFMDAERAKDYAQQAFDLSKKIGYERGIGNGYLQFGNYYYNQSKNDSSEIYHNLALKKFEEIKSVKGQIFALHSLATIEMKKGDYDKSIVLTKSILDMYNDDNRKNSDLGKFDLRGSEYEILGEIYFEKGNYKIALEHTLTALRFFEDKSDEVRTADALKQLADIEYQLENYDSSIEYAEKAISIYEKHDDKIYMSYAYNTAGLAAEELGDSHLAHKHFDASINLAREMNVQTMISQSLNDLARLHYNKGEYLKSRILLKESLALSELQDIKLNQTEALQEIANLDVKEGKFEQALTHINKNIAISEKIGALPTLRDALKTRAEIRNGLNQSNLAYKDLQEYHFLNDSIFNIKKSQQIEELKAIYETEKKETEIALHKEEINTLNEKAKVDKLTKGLYAGGMFTFVAVSGLLFFGFRQRMKRNRIAREKQEEIYKQEIAYKKKELTSQTLHLVQKNTFIQELMENLQNIKNSPEKFKMEFRRIVMLLKKENASDKDWEVFKTYFSEVHNDFDQKLKTLSEDISEKEIRLAAFLRMNLTTKEIAATLNVLPDSILKSKYRLKKKLGLNKETDLTQFLNSL
ncbi:tetratricopeptide repeat protein [Maribacter sp. TH_r10]|uniref:tetratricopeptide repeat protein n=1 Tax=Maribacter sp. TH_r10 TaxID=3082086 RepID=UPI0029534BB2|nr:tetratricopeptide repeat protein [Maribacter sp. TH_r10]MDV7138716.1 tetratricopeptide repeat protein [Maribacter sp. TH_r10]